MEYPKIQKFLLKKIIFNFNFFPSTVYVLCSITYKITFYYKLDGVLVVSNKLTLCINSA